MKKLQENNDIRETVTPDSKLANIKKVNEFTEVKIKTTIIIYAS